LDAVTYSRLCVSVAFHALVTFWSPAKVKVTDHPEIAVVPVLVTVTLPTKPPLHELCVP
jgi:hypothetical protein